MFPIRLLAVGAIALAGAATAHAQGCDTPGGCGSSPLFGTGALFAPNKHLARYPDANYPHCATKTYPISDWKYISKYCGPTLNPGTCYGYYPTKWRRWEEICPTGGEGGCAATLPGGVSAVPNVIHQLPPDVPMPLPQPAPLPPKEKDPIPKSEAVPEPLTIAPAPLPTVNVTAAPVSPAEHGKPAGTAPMLPLKALPNVVVPPVRDFPERSRK